MVSKLFVDYVDTMRLGRGTVNLLACLNWIFVS
jgi:hypothetical protein